MRTISIFLFFILLVALGSCSPSEMVTGDTPNVPSVVSQVPPSRVPLHTQLPISPIQGENTPMAPALPTPYDPGLQCLIEKAMEDLSTRFSIPAAQIRVAGAFDVVWPDSGLGCSQTGMAYAQVLTPGYLILLEYDNHKFEYHTDKCSYVTYCANPIPPDAGVPDK